MLEVANSNLPGKVLVSNYDLWVVDQWKLNFDIAQLLKKVKCTCEGVIWYSPPTGWYKFNFDGFAKGYPGPTVCGGVLCDHNGRIVSTL